MTDPVLFETTTPRLGLPMLFAAQAQKEFTVNEAHARLDLTVQCVVEGEREVPPADPADGECWIVGASPEGAWQDRARTLAGYQSGGWLFAKPGEGWRCFDRERGQFRPFRDGEWRIVATPAPPEAGTVIDVEARTAMADLIAMLRLAGIFPIG